MAAVNSRLLYQSPFWMLREQLDVSFQLYWLLSWFKDISHVMIDCVVIVKQQNFSESCVDIAELSGIDHCYVRRNVAWFWCPLSLICCYVQFCFLFCHWVSPPLAWLSWVCNQRFLLHVQFNCWTRCANCFFAKNAADGLESIARLPNLHSIEL